MKLMMKTSIALAAMLVVVIGCSDETPNGESTLLTEVVDSVAAAVAENLVEVGEVQAAGLETPVMPAVANRPELPASLFDVEAMLVDDNLLYGTFDGGLVVYDFAEQTQAVIPFEEKLQAITKHNGVVYVGGDYLYVLDNTGLTRLDNQLTGVVTCLATHKDRLMIGTTAGLFADGEFGREQLLDEMHVTALASDGDDGLWIGTQGVGLYRWDGNDFRRRYLLRDETMFDTVNTLAFSHRHLYAGTPHGLHVYDGGRWATYTTEDGLPDNNVVSIDASGWMVYAACDSGVVTLFDKFLDPVEKLKNQSASVLRVHGRKILAGTEREGILVKSGRMVRVLVAPGLPGGDEVLTMSH